jgi:hypothetical protein
MLFVSLRNTWEEGDIQTFSLVLTIWADLHDEDKCVTLAASYPSDSQFNAQSVKADLDFNPVHFTLYILFISTPISTFRGLSLGIIIFHRRGSYFRRPQSLGYELYSPRPESGRLFFESTIK